MEHVFQPSASNREEMAKTRSTMTQPGRSCAFAISLRLLDLRFNLPHQFHFNPAIHLQYFTGYGQTLRQYNQTSSGFRAGLCLWY